ncbi:MAG: carboxypeptidase regulatory-like domain-containing protein [Methanomicrobiaceae archaeon]|nr:carboxypeptidase regulatory-like domain-containing protein [Methanomicrobiaceae archaeon]
MNEMGLHKGMGAARFCVALIILAALIPAAQATVLSFSVVDETDQALLDGASIYSDGDYIGKTGSSGTYSYEHAHTSSFNVKIVMPGYDDWVDSVSSTATGVTASLSRKTIFLSITVYDAITLQPVSDVLIKLDGEDGADSGRSTVAGRVDFDVRAGATYNVEIVAPRYDTLLRTVEMGNSAKDVQYWLYRNDLFVIRVRDAETKSPLAGVRISVDDREKGISSDEGALSLYLERERSYSITCETDEYQTITETRYVTAEDAVFDYLMSKSLYSLSISVFDSDKTPVEGAAVYIDDAFHATTGTYGSAGLLNLKAGVHTIEVRREGFLTWTSDIEMRDGGTDLTVELAYASAVVTVHVADDNQQAISGARILVDGEYRKPTDNAGIAVLELAAHRTYNITALRDGYRPASVSHDIPSGTSAADVSLVLAPELDIALFYVAGIGILVLAGVALVFRWVKTGPRRRRPPGL